ncbi:MAG: magnesium transporter CorA family protein [Thermoleophilia bacterium]|nr:magnesium transporter CorA family protein [Thermoleophilia bacterium]
MPDRTVSLTNPSGSGLRAALPGLDAATIALLARPAAERREIRPLVERRGEHVVALLLVPFHDDAANAVVYRELNAVLSADRLVTVRRQATDGGLAAAPRLEEAGAEGREADTLFHILFDDVAEAFLEVIDGIYGEVDELEDEVDALTGEETRLRLGGLRHDVLHARKNVSALRSAVRRVTDGRLDHAAGGAQPLLSREVEAAFADTYDTLVRATEELDVARDLLSGVRDHLQARVAERQNEVVKKLTVVASLVLVPTLITGFYGQNFAPAFESAWWSIGTSVGLIAGTTVLQLAFFRWKRWI